MFKRKIEERLERLIKRFRCISICGARQVGKSFFLKNYAEEKKGEYKSLDDPLERDEANRDPLGWIKRHRRKGEIFVIDEAIKCPEIFSAVKVVVDEEDPVPTKIILASSSNYLLIRKIRESLAGRVALLDLYPLSWSEFSNGGLSKLSLLNKPESLPQVSYKGSYVELDRERESFLLCGGFPEVRKNDDWEFTVQWVNQYFEIYVLPLAVDLFNVNKQYSFERTFRQLCLRTGKLLNYSDIASSSDISSVTVKNYEQYFEAMMLCKEVHQFFKNPIKRLIKSSKVHILDPLLVNWNFGVVKDMNVLLNAGILGHIYESWLFSEIIKTKNYESLHFDISTWHTQDNAEVDLILEYGSHLIPLEIKHKKKITKRDLSGLRSWLEVHHKETPAAYIVYTGNKLEKLETKIWAIPDHYLFGIT